MPTRIELYEKYEIQDNNCPDWESMGVVSPKNQSKRYGYRRTMVMVDFIERPIEIPGNGNEFIVRFMSGEDMVCLGDFDEFCIRLHDQEEEMYIQDEIDEAVFRHFQNQNFNG